MKRVKSFWKGKDPKTNFKSGSSSSSSKVFGVPLNPRQPHIPEIIRLTTTYIEEISIQEPGLFRVSGHHAEVNSLKHAFDKGGAIDLKAFPVTNPHVIPSVLKQYLRELPEPLFSFNSYEALVTSYTVSDPEMRLACIKNVIQDLPRHYYVVLDYLFAFLHRVSVYSEFNKMDSSNLAICFAPNLLRSKSETTEQLVTDSHKSTSIIRIVIDSYSEIFEKDPITGDTVPVQTLTQFISDDHLLPQEFINIDLDKEIADIFEEENEEKQILALQQQQLQVSGERRPSVFQIFSTSPPDQQINATSPTNDQTPIITTHLEEDEDDEEEEEEELFKSPNSSTRLSPSLLQDQSTIVDNSQLHSISLTGKQNNSSTDLKIDGLMNLIEKTIFKLKEEFIQIALDLENGLLTSQEILLIASSMKNIINILMEGPDVDSQVVSSFDMSLDAESSEQAKRLETLKLAVVTKVTDQIPSLLEQISEESENIVMNPDIEREICLGDLITIVRTLRAVSDVINFLYNKWSQISPSQSPSLSNSTTNSPSFSHSPTLSTSPLSSATNSSLSKSPNNNNLLSIPSNPITIQGSKSSGAVKDTIQISTSAPTNLMTSKSASHIGNSQNYHHHHHHSSSTQFNVNQKITNENDVIKRYETINEILYESEQSIMNCNSKSELTFIAKIITNIQKIIHLSLEANVLVEDIPEPQINTLKSTPKHKLSNLISVVYVLIKEIRDQVQLNLTNLKKDKDNNNNSGSGLNNKQLLLYTQRFNDLFKLLIKLPAFQTYKSSQNQRIQTSQRNCQFMKESISHTLKKLKPLFQQVSANNKNSVDIEQLTKSTRNITKIKKLFEDPQIEESTGINFLKNDNAKSPKSSSHSISSFLRTKTQSLIPLNPTINVSSENFNEKIDTVKSLYSLLLDNVMNKLIYLEENYLSITLEPQLTEIINLLKNVILIFKEIK